MNTFNVSSLAGLIGCAVAGALQAQAATNWLLGSVYPAGGGNYTGAVQAIRSSVDAPQAGFLKLKSHCR